MEIPLHYVILETKLMGCWKTYCNIFKIPDNGRHQPCLPLGEILLFTKFCRNAGTIFPIFPDLEKNVYAFTIYVSTMYRTAMVKTFVHIKNGDRVSHYSKHNVHSKH